MQETQEHKTQEKSEKRNLLERYKKVKFSPKKYKYLEWTKGRGDNGKKCTSTAEKTGQIQIRKQDHKSVAQALYTTTR